MKTILFIHQSAELYGSDKTLFFLVRELPKYDIKPIVVLPEEGPLADLLRESGIELIISSVIKISRSMFTFLNILKLPFHIFSSLYKLNKKLNHYSIDLVHSNTLAVLGGVFYARWKGIEHLWHVHEIIEKPRIANKAYRLIVNLFSSHTVFNSKAALLSLIKENQKFKNKSSVIYNGIEKPDKTFNADAIENFKKDNLKLPSDALIIGIVGRISRWKGQLLLLEAFEKLQKDYSNLYLLIVGSPPPDQEYYLTNLKKKIVLTSLENKVQIHAFTPDIWNFLSSMDICVVPSTEPEPFGLVAVEAMYSGKPVIAAKHGGLLEIIEHQKTGLLFEPKDVDALYSSLKLLIEDKALRESLAKNGQEYALERFTIEKYTRNFVKIYQKTMMYV